ncbi:MAG: aldose 1-epimerase family protein [Bacteroidia bacterium]
MSVTITNGTLTAAINPKGAELFSFKSGETEYIWEGNPDFWGKHSPVLFPIVGTLKDNQYTIDGKTYNLPRHGFARDNEFTIKHKEDNKVVFSLIASDKTKEVYPFNFELELIYTLTDSSLTLDYVVSNNSDSPMPFCIGAHPAFSLPGNFEDYKLVFEKNEPLVSIQLVNDLLSDITAEIPVHNGTLSLQHSLFANDALIFTNLESRSITITKQDKEYLKVTYPKFPHLGLWTKMGAPFICIEPWQGYSDADTANGDFFTKEGAITLQSGEKYTSGFTVALF